MERVSRRAFLSTSSTLGVAVVPALAGCATAPAQDPASTQAAEQTLPAAALPAVMAGGDSQLALTLRVNATTHQVRVDPRTTLLDTLREHLGLTGTKKGCDQGQCGACTVHLNGKRVLSCLTLAASVGPRPVVTIEGLASTNDNLHPMQQAFIDNDAFQCGYCTPGQIMSAVACVNEGHATNPTEIREYMSGNICRCAAYPNIVAAIVQARPAMRSA